MRGLPKKLAPLRAASCPTLTTYGNDSCCFLDVFSFFFFFFCFFSLKFKSKKREAEGSSDDIDALELLDALEAAPKKKVCAPVEEAHSLHEKDDDDDDNRLSRQV